jgi:hypothetical protein
MPGYLLIEEKMLQPQASRGFILNPVRMGFLDFMRELRQGVFPFNRSQKLYLVGLEEVLLAAGAGDNLLASSLCIREILASKANELNAEMGQIQVIFRRPLRKLNDLFFEPGGGQRVNLTPIFGRPILQTDPSGNEFYQVGFNLT